MSHLLLLAIIHASHKVEIYVGAQMAEHQHVVKSDNHVLKLLLIAIGPVYAHPISCTTSK